MDIDDVCFLYLFLKDMIEGIYFFISALLKIGRKGDKLLKYFGTFLKLKAI